MQDGVRWEFIYNQINGLDEPDVCEWVKDETAEGGELAGLVEQIYQARNRLCERAKLDPGGDPDLHALFCGFEDMAQICGKLMYRYGYQDGIEHKKTM